MLPPSEKPLCLSLVLGCAVLQYCSVQLHSQPDLPPAGLKGEVVCVNRQKEEVAIYTWGGTRGIQLHLSALVCS
uniref:Uncharacterized protein n=1 Tax=Zosterops lateralis melanops TaxID=1220523 RepID=A0A8D2NYG1_ZOSLA